MLGGDGMGLALEYMLSVERGLLWPRSIVPSAQAAASRSLRAINAYPLLRAPERVWQEVRVSPWVEEQGGTVRQVVK
jgi:hypothetical protein